MNRVCEILNIKYPVIQAPMAWITSSNLVAAVSNAGGLGVLGTSADFTEVINGVPNTMEKMREVIRNTKKLTDKPFGINVFPEIADPYGFSKATIELAKEEGVNILVVAGNVSYDEIREWKEKGFIVIMREDNPSIRGAQLAEKAGADIIVFTQSNGTAKWRTTPHKYGIEGLEANKNGDLNPSPGSFFHGMLKGDLDAGVNTVSNLSGLIKSIDSCEKIVLELAIPFKD